MGQCVCGAVGAQFVVFVNSKKKSKNAPKYGRNPIIFIFRAVHSLSKIGGLKVLPVYLDFHQCCLMCSGSQIHRLLAPLRERNLHCLKWTLCVRL